VWTVAGIMILPTGLAAGLVALIYVHVLVLANRHKSARPHRMILTAAAATLATAAAASAVSLFPAATFPDFAWQNAAIPVTAIALFVAVDTVLLATSVYLATKPESIKAVLPDRDGLGFEIATDLLGVLTGELLLYLPWLAPISCGGLVLLHRSSLVRQLQVAAMTDAKTTLLNAGAWRERALVAVTRATAERERIAVVVIDLDHFKVVNDRHGHLVGDRVLGAVASAIRSETRSRDIVGRFGGEEFLVLIDGRAAAAHAIDIATRIRERIAALRLPNDIKVTATIGVAHGEANGPETLDALLLHADWALYEGKDAGRDRVRALAVN
jgi:diguanylate cyclase (GGDEF)-like protein